jgi:hypothetical protein
MVSGRWRNIVYGAGQWKDFDAIHLTSVTQEAVNIDDDETYMRRAPVILSVAVLLLLLAVASVAWI